ncbi:MAG: YwqG family protein [Chloroflexota bacterium]
MERGIDNLKKLIHEHGFGELEDVIVKLARPSIRVQTTRVEDEGELAIGQSKLGGRPDLPKEVDWVVEETQKGEQVSLPFMGQINLADVAPYNIDNQLPNRGILYFFTGAWHVPPREQGSVLYYDGALSALERKPFPDDLPPTPPYEWSDHRFDPCAMTFIPEMNLNFDSIEDLPLYPNEGARYDKYDLYMSTNYRNRKKGFPLSVNRLLGVPHDMPLECQLIAEVGKPYNVTPEQRAKAKKRKSEWQLLFQVGSDENANMMWSDMGTICFYIRKKDLAERKFDDVCVGFFSS